MQNLIEAFNKNSNFIARQMSHSQYMEMLKSHDVQPQGSDSATRSELAKVLARKNIVLN